ncbi:Crp/Fnr family transcriptional regulator [Ahrensia sp. R2A130]|uniref:Crp/Fnr family transcriptional regulator n=1 Tax=Ahrensia sp. R2A130 TaxID=744979 RepID=UPI0001E0E845|nr:Crp/Fnr family transcriptional regulator [Ahrensia sp. R2A130]EFL90929.1 cyclic nucleotide-binding protein [Ahrensia sp. R2A130]
MRYDLDHMHYDVPAPFNQLPEDAFHHHTVRQGMTMFRQDDPTRGMFFVLSGEAELRRHTEAGTEIVLHRASSGETFAEASLFAERYHCDAVAVSDCEAVRIDRDAVLNRMKTDAAFSMDIAARFARQVQAGRRLVELLNVRSARERVHMALADGMLTGNVIAFARRIGLTQEATYRALAALVRSGVVRKTARGRYEPYSSAHISSSPIPASTS